MEIVSLGGRATLPPALKGACELLNLDVPAGFNVRYWKELPAPTSADGKSSSQTQTVMEEVYYDTRVVDQYVRGVRRPRLVCEKEHLLLRKQLHPKCVNFPSVRIK